MLGLKNTKQKSIVNTSKFTTTYRKVVSYALDNSFIEDLFFV